MPQHEWNIQTRATVCAVTGQPFSEGELIHSALYWKNGQYVRVDMNAAAWKNRNDNLQPLSAWQVKFEISLPPPVEPLRKDDAETLLRKLMVKQEPEKKNACYILALMLERKKILKPLDKQSNNGESILIYEHVPSGDTWIISDPKLRLDQLGTVQDEVAALLKAETVT